VSIWLNALSCGRLETGTLAKLIAEKNVARVTTNPSIFHAAISGAGGPGTKCQKVNQWQLPLP
jgi:transaldolase